ncbi:MAG: hypothetical protein JO206_12955 [Solirubrobacterales bacterium]|nr:hypothetical protein [Solirubrobacterales bacterium]
MTWVETSSPSFRARHEAAHAHDADRVLHSLERTRTRLAQLFPSTIAELTVVLHGGSISLSMTNPLLPLVWLATAPAARRYVGGWAGRDELHVLAPAALEARASAVPGSREMLALTAAALYTRRVITENNEPLHRARAPARVRLGIRWAWLLEGAARYFAGQTEHARPAIARRLHEGRRPRFPPGIRDAPLLGATVIDLLARERGEPAAVALACRLHPQGARAALSAAFRGRPYLETEGAWRSHLTRLVGAA